MKEINYKKINKELKDSKKWCCFYEEKIEGQEKFKKIPINANICKKNRLYKAKSNDNNTLSTFETAENKSKLLKLGMMYKIEYPYLFLDFDNCIDNNGNISDNVRKIMEKLNSYTEISNSGKGIHIIVKVSRKFETKVDHKQGIEIYGNRFCVMTGDVLEEYSSNIEDRTENIEEIYKEYFTQTNTNDSSFTQRKNNIDLIKEAEEIISNLRKSKIGKKFNLFYDGNWKLAGNYPSHSEADSAFMFMLAKETGKNIIMMDYIFRHSGMYRKEKYDQVHYADGSTYGQALINNAVTLVTNFSGRNKISLQEKIIDLILDSAGLFHNNLDECFGIIKVNGHKEIHNIDSQKFRNYVFMIAYKNFGKTISTTSLGSIINTLKGIALYAHEEEQNHFRCYLDNDILYYDLTNKDWQIIQITKEGWNIINEHQILFTRESHQKSQVMPKAKGNIELLWKYFKIPEEQKILFLSCICSMFIPDIPRPLIILHGEKGASKTTSSKMIREIVDPSTLGIINLPENIIELVQILSKHYLIPFDNIEYIDNKISNALCRAITGEAFSKRKLYSDNEDFYYIFKRSIIINGILVPAKRPDLLDRSILFKLERIKEEDRIDENALWNNFNSDKPYILGGILELLSKAIGIYKNTKLPKLYRMADFTKWGYCFAEVYNKKGKEFMEQFSNNKEFQNTELIENNSVIQALIEYMSNASNEYEIKCTSTELYEILTMFVSAFGKPPKNWITSGKALKNILQDYKEVLEDCGILVDFKRTNSKRYIHIINTNIKKSDTTVTNI